MKKRRTPRQVAAGTVMAMLLLAGHAQAQLLFVSADPPAAVYTYTPNGTVGTFSTSFTDPKGLVFNSAGDLFVGDLGSGNIYKFTPGGTQSTYANIGGSTAIPVGAAFDSAGNLYVSDYHSGNIYKIAPGGGSQTTFASGLGDPEALAFDSASNLYVACQEDGGNGLVVQIMPNGTTNTFASGLSDPAGLAFDGAGNLYVSCETGDEIIEIATNGTQSTFFSGLYDPDSIAFDSEGNLFVAEPGASFILKISPQASATPFAFTSGEPSALAFHPALSVQAGYASNAFQLSATMAPPYHTTIVQASTNLVKWTGVYTNTPPFTFTDSVAAKSRFYRAVLDTNYY
jgi:sugar lactone lactonase YvrE